MEEGIGQRRRARWPRNGIRCPSVSTPPSLRRPTAKLRALNDRYGLGNNYLLVVLLERLDDYADAEALHEAFDDFIAEYGALTKGP